MALVERLGYQVLDTAARTVAGGGDRGLAVGGNSCRRLSDESRGIGNGSRLLQSNPEKPIGEADGEVYATGGGSRSDVWMQCRADATGRVLHRPACGESAFGAAVLSAAGAHYNNIVEAVGHMVRLERTFSPDRQRIGVYDRVFDLFCSELRMRGYL